MKRKYKLTIGASPNRSRPKWKHDLRLWFTVGVQSFSIGERFDTPAEGRWFKRIFEKALASAFGSQRARKRISSPAPAAKQERR
jgi:hypothetical protein